MILLCVVSHISAGLGNQLFQYAAGRALAKRLGASFQIDIGSYVADEGRQLGLRDLGITTPSLSWLGRKRLAATYHRTLSKVIRPLTGPLVFEILDDHQRGFQQMPPRSARSIYLRGYWQSERYFSAIQSELRAEYQQTLASPSMRLAADLGQIRETNAVCLHVRRGDMVSNPIYAQVHAVQEADYYSRAIETLKALHGDLQFFVFSDDPEWPQQNLNIDAPVTFMNVNHDRSATEDFILMSACRHFVIANSTFSWWAAWLSQAEDKVVIAPKKWRVKEPGPPPDLIPEHWTIL